MSDPISALRAPCAAPGRAATPLWVLGHPHEMRPWPQCGTGRGRGAVPGDHPAAPRSPGRARGLCLWGDGWPTHHPTPPRAQLPPPGSCLRWQPPPKLAAPPALERCSAPKERGDDSSWRFLPPPHGGLEGSVTSRCRLIHRYWGGSVPPQSGQAAACTPAQVRDGRAVVCILSSGHRAIPAHGPVGTGGVLLWASISSPVLLPCVPAQLGEGRWDPALPVPPMGSKSCSEPRWRQGSASTKTWCSETKLLLALG